MHGCNSVFLIFKWPNNEVACGSAALLLISGANVTFHAVLWVSFVLQSIELANTPPSCQPFHALLHLPRLFGFRSGQFGVIIYIAWGIFAK